MKSNHLEVSNNPTNFLLNLIETPKEYNNEQEQKWFNEYQRRTKTINALLTLLANKPLSDEDKQHLFSYLLLQFEKNNKTDTWPKNHPLQENFYAGRMKSQPRDGV